MRTRLVLNADDFGRSRSINRAVIRAHLEGVLTSASLMVTGDAADEAVVLARRNPALAVGLHLVLAGSHPAAAGARYVLSRAARADLAREVATQFDLFAATGLPLDHVNGHMHLHLIPGAFATVATLAASRGAGGIRLAGDDLGLALRHDRRLVGTKLLWAAAFGVFHRNAVRRLAALERRGGAPVLASACRVYGLMQTGRMTEAYVLAALKALGAGPRRRPVPSRRGAEAGGMEDSPAVVEFYFHPDTAPQSEPLGPNPGDLATLLSPAVRQAIQDGGFRLTTYGRIREDRRGDGVTSDA